jgi:hypothetical protein
MSLHLDQQRGSMGATMLLIGWHVGRARLSRSGLNGLRLTGRTDLTRGTSLGRQVVRSYRHGPCSFQAVTDRYGTIVSWLGRIPLSVRGGI